MAATGPDTASSTMVIPIQVASPYHPLPISDDPRKDVAPRKILGIPTFVIAGVCYCSASAALVLLNKHALASFSFTAPNALLLFQCSITVILAKSCEALRLVKPLQPLKLSLVTLWFPTTCIFVMMLGSGFYALQLMGIGMFSVWKQLANLTTGTGIPDFPAPSNRMPP
jgi:GDP-mannose transporter